MSSLRRLAQTNNATPSTSSPLSIRSPRASSPMMSPTAGTTGMPSTPRTRISYPISAANSPSLSASQPFDWDAARHRKPPPYASPLAGARVRALRKSEVGAKSSPKRVIRKKGWHERITSIPSAILFEISLFPHNVPLPASKTSARLIGGMMHFIHFCVRVSQMRKIPEEELTWEDLYNESNGSSWFDWSTPLTFLLIAGALLNAVYLVTRIKLYNLHYRSDPVSSSNATFVSTELDFSPLEPPPLTQRFRSWLTHQFSVSWRFLLNFKPPPPRSIGPGARTERVQQLSVWVPGELEMNLFVVYSPVHAFMWIATTGSNWILMFSIMTVISAQFHILVNRYEGLLKDRAIISAEVMHEYDQKYVNPRINPIRKDAAVMTHQSEIVNIWED